MLATAQKFEEKATDYFSMRNRMIQFSDNKKRVFESDS